MKQNENFKRALFMPIIIEATKMKIEIGPSKIVYLTSVKDPDVYKYLISQLYLFSDLSLQRNFLWKSYLDQIFPIRFVFDQIFDETMAIDYRSAFCKLAQTLFVDHEPFNPQMVPKLCRLMVDDDKVKDHRAVKQHQLRITGIQEALK